MDAATPLTPAAVELLRDINTELSRPAAALAPVGLRRVVAQTGVLLLAMAQRLDHHETGKGATL